MTRAQKVDDFDVGQKDLDKLVTPESLRDYGFYNDGFGQVPLIKFDKRNNSKKALECLKRSLASLPGKGKSVALCLFLPRYLLLIVTFVSIYFSP